MIWFFLQVLGLHHALGLSRAAPIALGLVQGGYDGQHP